MVQFKTDGFDNPCGTCKSYDGGFCYKWAFPIKEDHVPCTKFKQRDKINNNTPKKNPISRELVKQLINELTDFKGTIIGKSFDEIYIGLDDLIEGYTRRFNME